MNYCRRGARVGWVRKNWRETNEDVMKSEVIACGGRDCESIRVVTLTYPIRAIACLTTGNLNKSTWTLLPWNLGAFSSLHVPLHVH